jgi:hypothetical protein
MANPLTEFQMNHYFGWTQGSNMPSTYVHLSGKDLDGAILKMNGQKVDTPLPQQANQPIVQEKTIVKEQPVVHALQPSNITVY